MGNQIFKRFTKEQAEVYVKGLRKTFVQFEVAAKTLSKCAWDFSGKVYNKRFCEKLNADLESVFGYGFYNYGTPDERKYIKVRAYESNSYCDDVRICVKLNDTTVAIPQNFDPSKYKTYDTDSEFNFTISFGLGTCFDGKRIIASAFESRVNDAIDRARVVVDNYEDALKNWDVYISKMKKIDEQLTELAISVNPLFISDRAETLINGESLSYIRHKSERGF